jgi:exodeoxyribonuclease VIII
MIATMDELLSTLDKNEGQGYLLRVAEEVYRSHPYVSQSELKVFSQQTPAHFREQRLKPKKDSDAMRLGTAVHTAILEPMEYEKRYMLGPKVNRRTKKGKEQWLEALQEAIDKGMELLEPDIYYPPIAMRERVRKSKFFNEVLSHGVTERAVFAKSGGIFCKGKMDYFKPEEVEIIDLKSTLIAAPQVFEKDIKKFKYHWQAAFYIDLIKAVTGQDASFKILAVEKIPPFGISLQEIGFDLLAIARREIAETQARLALCYANDDWPGYPEKLFTHRANEYEWKAFKALIHGHA